MKIYTKKGDRGQTSLFGGGPIPKNDERIEAYGSIDELNSVVGCAVAEMKSGELRQILIDLQKQLFVVGSELASAHPSSEKTKGFIQKKHIQNLENQIDAWEKELKPLTQFILPGGAQAAAWLHLARTVCRRAERRTVALSHRSEVRPEILAYLNRLSDWFFVLARLINRRAGVEDVVWEGVNLWKSS